MTLEEDAKRSVRQVAQTKLGFSEESVSLILSRGTSQRIFY